MRYIIMLCLWALQSMIVSAQSPVVLPGKIFMPGVISTGDVIGISIAPGNKEICFVKTYGSRDTLRLMHTYLVNGKWTRPQFFSFSGPEYNHINPFITPDNRRLFFDSNEPVPGRPSKRNFDIYTCKKIKSGWSDPVNMDELNSDSSDFHATAASNGNVYFVSRRSGGYGNNDIYMARYINGHYLKPSNLGANVNSDQNESNPYISPKEDFLILFSFRPEGLGAADLYISFQKKGKWSKLQNLGRVVNSSLGEFCPTMSPDGKYFCWSVTEPSQPPNPKSIENIHYVETKQLHLDSLRAKAVY